jgi:hypothetical protein
LDTSQSTVSGTTMPWILGSASTTRDPPAPSMLISVAKAAETISCSTFSRRPEDSRPADVVFLHESTHRRTQSSSPNTAFLALNRITSLDKVPNQVERPLNLSPRGSQSPPSSSRSYPSDGRLDGD